MAEKEYIEREALVERLKKEECDCEWLWAILDIPAADVAPVKHGHWILFNKRKFIALDNADLQFKVLGYPHRNILGLRCSVCKIVSGVDDSIKYDYCPHCGCKMNMDGGEQK